MQKRKLRSRGEYGEKKNKKRNVESKWGWRRQRKI